MNNKLIIWITGLSAAGKTTLAESLEETFRRKKVSVLHIDGDDLRRENKNLGFSREDRRSNVMSAISKANFYMTIGDIAIVSLISPYKQDRDDARSLTEKYTDAKFVEIFIDTPIDICINRDPKGLYKKAKAGEIKNFTGIDDPYEAPENPEIYINGNKAIDLKDVYDKIIKYGN
jgi:adenylylsulfate kinase